MFDILQALQPFQPIAVLPPDAPFVLPRWSRVIEQYRYERLPYCVGVVVEGGEIVGAAWGHYRRRYVHIEELNLEPDTVHNPLHMDQTLAMLEYHVGGGHVPIFICGVHGLADAPWADEILTRNGYRWQAGYYVKE